MSKKTAFIVPVLFILFIVKATAMQTVNVEQVKNEITEQLSKDLKGSSKNSPLLILVDRWRS